MRRKNTEYLHWDQPYTSGCRIIEVIMGKKIQKWKLHLRRAGGIIMRIILVPCRTSCGWIKGKNESEQEVMMMRLLLAEDELAMARALKAIHRIGRDLYADHRHDDQ